MGVSVSSFRSKCNLTLLTYTIPTCALDKVTLFVCNKQQLKLSICKQYRVKVITALIILRYTELYSLIHRELRVCF